MKICFASDLHLEFGPCELVGSGDVLILAGDICVVEEIKRFGYSTLGDVARSQRHESVQRYEKFFRLMSSKFKHVVVVMGNHEFYGGNFVKHPKIYQDALKMWGTNIYLLEDSCIDFSEFRIIGSTLWTDCDRGSPLAQYDIERSLNDYTHITTITEGNYRKLKPQDTIKKHKQSFAKLEELVQVGKPVIVVTHHAPSFRSVPESHKNAPSNPAYASNLEDFILDNPNIRTWIHGHMHDPVDYLIGNCQVISNPRGYFGYQVSSKTHQLKVLEV